MRAFTQNLEGRVKNFTLPKNRPLVPVYEAVVNSLHAIDERRKQDSIFSDGRIEIMAIRSNQMTVGNERAPFESFQVVDNGVGFTTTNMDSFLDADSTYKAEIGGKGVGRFSWLKTFRSVQISSVFSENGVLSKREFFYKTENAGIDDAVVDVEDDEPQQTSIHLRKYYSDYSIHVPKNLDTIAQRIVQHCLVYFLDKNCPTILLKEDGEDSINLNKLFADRVQTADNTVSVTLNNQAFTLLHVKVTDKSFDKGNRLFLCANNRLVESEQLDRYIVDLDKQMFENDGFWYVGLLTGRFWMNT